MRPGSIRKRAAAFVPALVVVLSFVLQGAFAQNASALSGTPCLQTGLETVATDAPDYPPGSTVHITGTGYAPGCDATVQISRPDSVVESFTASTDLEGNISYDYLLPPPPGVIGQYGLDILGGDGPLASMTFTDGGVRIRAQDVSSDPAFGHQTDVYAIGDTSYVRAFSALATSGYKFEAFNAAGTSVYLGPCKTGSTTPSDSYAPTTISGAGQWEWVVHEWTSSNCTTGPVPEDSDNTSQPFSVAQPTVYSNSALTTQQTVFGPSGTAYVVVNGFIPSHQDGEITWIKPNGSVACANTGASDRPDSDSNGRLPNTAASFLQFPPNATATGDPWNQNGLYDSTCLTATFAGNPGTWKIKVTPKNSANTGFTVPVFTVDTTPPTVTINQAGSQADPTTGSPINFTATFSEPVSGFTGADVSFAGSTAGTGGTAAGLSATVTGGPSVYNVAVSGMATRGNVVVSVPAGGAIDDPAGNPNTASSSTDNSVTWDRVPATTTPVFSPASPKTNDSLTASTTTSDPDGDSISVAWTWLVSRGGDICTIQTNSSASAPAGVRSVSLDLSANYVPTTCSGAMINPLNPSKGDVVIPVARPNDGLFDGSSQSASATIANTAPRVTLSAGNDLSVNEGSTHTYSYAISDPDGDSIASVTASCGANGTKSNDAHTDTTGSFNCTFPDGPAGSIVSAQATDSGFGATSGNTDTQSVTVSNVAPTVHLSSLNDVSVNEGSTHTYSYTISDPGQDTVSSVTTSCGANGTKSNDTNSDTSGSFQCMFPDGPAGSTVSASATDSDGDPGNSDTQSVAVNNVAPTVHLSSLNDLSVNEGSTHTYSYTISDPGTDTVSSVTTSCGANGTKSADTNTDTSGSFKCTFPDGPAGSTVSASATDSDGDTGAADTQSVTVNNVAPTVTLAAGNDLSVAEGSTHTYSYTITDPGQDTVSSVTTSCGANGTKSNDTNSDASGSFQCTFPDGPSSSTVSAAATDSDGDTGAADTQSVTVNNVAPTVHLSSLNDLSVNEGSTHTYSYTISDPGQDTVSSVTTSCGANGTNSDDTNTDSAGSFKCTFPDGPAGSTVSVSATDSDGDTGNTDSQSVTVNNVAPTVTLAGGNDLSVNEGSTRTYSYAISDPGADTVSAVTTSCGANGTKSDDTNTDTSGSFKCTFPDGPAGSTVSASATDSDGDTGAADTQSVTVNNVAPTVTLAAGNDLSVAEGSTHTYSYTISDPGQDTVTGVTTSCSGTGSKVAGSDSFTDTGGSFQCSFADGPSSSTVSAAATDSDGDTGAADTQSVTVNNVAPTVTLAAGNDLSVAEGSTHTYSYTISDPGQDTVSSVTTSCGANGTKSNDTNSDASGSFQCTFPDGPSSSTVSVAATDSDGDTGAADTQSVTVNNVAPTVTLAGPQTVDEGTTKTYTFTVVDPGTDTFTVSSGYPDCGTGGNYVAGSLTTNSGGGSFQCTFPDGPATTDVRIRVADSDGASDTDSEAVHVVQVQNVDPAVTAPADQSSDEGDSHSFALGSFSDPGPDSPWSVSVDWGDGSPATTFTTAAVGSLGSSAHTYADGPGTRTVTVTVTDGNGGSGSATFQVDVHNFAPAVHLSNLNDLSVSEGSTHTYSYTISDPGTDTVSSVATSCGANGTKSNDTNTTTGGSFDCTFANGPAGSAVSASATDSDGDTGNTDSQSVTVNNVAPGTPSLVSPADGAKTNDDTPTFDWSNVTDAGGDTVTYSLQADNNGCGFASPEIDVSGLSTSEYTPATSLPAGTYCWRVRATDSDGANSGYSRTRTVTIDVTRPSVTIDQASSQADPTGASPIRFAVVFSEPVSGFNGSDVAIGGTAGGSKTVVVTDSGDQMTFDVAVSGMTDGTVVASIPADGAQDAAGNGNTASTSTDNSVLYDATGPTLTVNQASGQGDPTSSSPIRFTAVFGEPVSGFQNADVTIGGTAGGSMSASVTNPTSDGRTYDIAVTGMTTSGTVTVSVGANKAQDAAGNGNAASTSTDNTVTWNQQTQNTAPVVTITSPAFGSLYAKGSANVSLSASFTDPDAGQTHTCSINWDDGAVTNPAVNEAARTCSQAHTFANAGVYTIVVTICDSAGGCGTAETWVVVYDPSAGFVTGGGWIDVAAGSYPANPTLRGRANFGFNAKYQNGNKPPSGQTEFNFEVGNFNFHSETYDWLVVSGYKAQFRGTGSVNGVPGYDFRLTGYDGQLTGGGGLDKFRIKVTRNGQTVFDNRMGVPEDPDVADPQVIAGGSIVIHR